MDVYTDFFTSKFQQGLKITIIIGKQMDYDV